VQQTQRFIEMFSMSGFLYGEGFAHKFRDDMIDELAEHGFPRPTELDLDVPLSVQLPYEGRTGGQRAAYLVPMSGRLWRCFCGAYFDTGFACLACRDPVCPDCVREEAHVCIESKRQCWEDVMVPKRLIEVEGKGDLLEKETREKRIEKFRISRLTRTLKEQAKAQETKKAKKARQERKREAEADEKRLRALRKKAPWLAEKMGLKKKGRPT
jgi:hypothetical protein